MSPDMELPYGSRGAGAAGLAAGEGRRPVPSCTCCPTSAGEAASSCNDLARRAAPRHGNNKSDRKHHLLRGSRKLPRCNRLRANCRSTTLPPLSFLVTTELREKRPSRYLPLLLRRHDPRLPHDKCTRMRAAATGNFAPCTAGPLVCAEVCVMVAFIDGA